jgi:hypothetical protein
VTDERRKMLRKIISVGQTGADRAGLDFAIETGLEHGGYVPWGRKAEMGKSLSGTTWLSSGLARILREPEGISRKAMAP